MSALRRFERFFERAVEGTVQRVFRPPLHPVDIAKQLERAMEEHRRPGLRSELAPNEYHVLLNPRDHAAYESFSSQIRGDLLTFAHDLAAERDYRFVGPVTIRFDVAPEVRQGTVRVTAAFAEPSAPERTGDRRAFSSRPPSAPTIAVDDTAADGNTVRLSLSALAASASPAAGARAYVELDGGSSPTRVEVGPAGITVGRALENDLVVDDTSVSRRHLRISVVEGEYVAEDLGSSNGTRLNKRRIRRASLRDGDALVLGAIALRFRRE